ncbi:NAD(P)H-dependent oxidoreductase [Qipengyuania sp. S6317L1]|uniref:FMN-dependent NADH-azoreductase n=1 Tax=Qipengyuania sp. S6317L1 TaxID=2926410 RepID=UPI001FF25612|nr:NAD(P)H-dependent oxidoreductase [Qipengyuania sp. S6317L1]MCK0099654.1 NAD(P)H-dependent oxidoreductase [Qipengyuania sp. S6317L1]
MTHMLRIDASSRPGPDAATSEASFSRGLADQVQRHLERTLGQVTLTERDLVEAPIPHIDNQTIAGFYTPADQMTTELQSATALSDALIDEVEQADILLISCPIYNFGVPSAMKAWIDHVVRIGRTFAYENGEFRGLLENKRAIVAYSYGAPGYSDDGPLSSYDFMRPYLTMILNFIGISDVQGFVLEGTTGDPQDVAAAQAGAKKQIEEYFAGGAS